MSPDDRKRAYRMDMLLASAMVAAGLAIAGLSIAEIKARNQQMAQATQPLHCRPLRLKRPPHRSRKDSFSSPSLPHVAIFVADFTASPAAVSCRIMRSTAQLTYEAGNEDRRRQANRLFDAADQPVIPAGPLSVLQPGIFRHHLSHRSGGARHRGTGAAGSH